MTGFEFLTPDRQVQQTTFANGGKITANFSTSNFKKLPARSILLQSSRGDQPTAYTPAR
jgi:hypothetical protein